MSHDLQIPDEPEPPQSERDEEVKSIVSAKGVYDSIWEEFAKDRKNNRSQAYAKLQQNFAMHAAKLVPYYMTAKEHMGIIGEIEQYTKGEGGTETGDPQEAISAWLRGERDLSRIPLEKLQ